MKRQAFTLLELLCVLAISAVIIVLVAQSATTTLRWVKDDYEQEVLVAQMDQALDLMENDIRIARDINSAYFVNLYDLSATYETLELRLISSDTGGSAATGTIAYTTSVGDSAALTAYRKSPYQLYRSERDSVHDGARQPVALYLNSKLSNPKGFCVRYYDKDGRACTLSDEIYSIEIYLSARTNQGVLVEKSRRTPLAGKYDGGG